MKKLFIESSEFTKEVEAFLADDIYAAFQQELMEDPDVGTVMKGCGGLRKVRVSDPRRGKGKRGGARVIYLHVPEADWIFLLDIYGKNQKDDLRPAEKKMLKHLAEEFKAQAVQAPGRTREENRE